MDIKEFIEKAIEGGWRPLAQQNHDWRDSEGTFHATHIDSVFLNPIAWQAVGKVEGWNVEVDKYDDPELIGKSYLSRMHDMIDALDDGKTIKQYLETL